MFVYSRVIIFKLAFKQACIVKASMTELIGNISMYVVFYDFVLFKTIKADNDELKIFTY